MKAYSYFRCVNRYASYDECVGDYEHENWDTKTITGTSLNKVREILYKTYGKENIKKITLVGEI